MPVNQDQINSFEDTAGNDNESEHQKVCKLPPQGYPSAPPKPITRQPTTRIVPSASTGWTNIPLPSSNGDFPAGLDYLSGLDQVRVRQIDDEDCTKLQIKKQFQIKNNMGDILFSAIEDSNYLSRVCCGPLHSFTTKIMDTFGNELIQVHRPVACEFCCFFFYPQKIKIYSPPGKFIGVIEERDSCFTTTFGVENPNGKTLLTIEGPCCRSWFGVVNFQIFTPNSTAPIGKITREWSDCVREYTSDANNFRVTFPRDMDVRTKAMLISVCFLFDYMFFEYKLTRFCLNRRCISIALILVTIVFLYWIFHLF